MDKKKFTLAERFALTRKLSSATQTVAEGPQVEPRRFLESMEILEQSRDAGVYGNRTVLDAHICDGQNFPETMRELNSAKTEKDVRTSQEIFYLERAMKKGDNEAEKKLRSKRDNDEYGRRCRDINLDA